MLPFFPRQISTRAITIYTVMIILISLIFNRYAMRFSFILIDLMWVFEFFLFVSFFSSKWKSIPEKRLKKNLFWWAFSLRAAWVVFSYYFYKAMTGVPFEFSAADSLGYHDGGVFFATLPLKDSFRLLFIDTAGVSDSGEIFIISLFYRIFGDSIMVWRLIKSVIGAGTVLLVYRLARRNIGESAARMAAIFTCFMPNMIYYCGLHLKENEMLFFLVLFLERADYLIRSRKYNIITIAVPILVAVVLFTFRTVLGAAAIFAFATGLIFTNKKIIGHGKRIMLIAWGVLAAITLAGGVISTEIEGYWNDRGSNQQAKRDFQSAQGSKIAKYATGTVMAPMMFVIPFPTMVDTNEQYNQQVISGGNYVRNVLGVFVLIALFTVVFINKQWRNLSLIGGFAIAYLGIVAMSGFANSERFVLPALPCLLIMAAYGVSVLNAKNMRYVRIWYWVLPVMIFGWAAAKLINYGIL